MHICAIAIDLMEAIFKIICNLSNLKYDANRKVYFIQIKFPNFLSTDLNYSDIRTYAMYYITHNIGMGCV